MGIEKLIDFVLQFLKDFLPFFVVRQYEQAVVYRFGKVYRVVEQGIWFKIPFADDPSLYVFITTTLETPVQSLVTKDNKAISVKTIIKYNIFDVELHSTSIYDAVDALSDITQGHVMHEANGLTYDECRDTAGLGNNIAKKVRADVKKYGIAIEQVTLTNFIETSNFRLFNDN